MHDVIITRTSPDTEPRARARLSPIRHRRSSRTPSLAKEEARARRRKYRAPSEPRSRVPAYASIEDLMARTRCGARTGTLAGKSVRSTLAINRRSAQWQIERAIRPMVTVRGA